MTHFSPALLAALAAAQTDGDHPGDVADRNRLPEAEAEDLARRHALYSSSQPFEPGQLVTQRPGLGRYRAPPSGRPAVVMEVWPRPSLAQAAEDDADAEVDPMDMAIGVLVRDRFTMFAVDSRRFEPWKPEHAARASGDREEEDR